MTKPLILTAAVSLLLLASCGTKQAPKPKNLVVYYSQTSNTRTVAQEFASQLDADMEEIVAVNPYDGDFQATIDRCLQEREAGVIPEIQPITSDLSKYDNIFIGYPVWFGTYAPPVAAFLNQVDLSGKNIYAFCTFGSGGLISSIRDLVQAQPNARFITGYGVRAARLAAAPQEIERFLKENHLIEGEVTPLGDFEELHPVSEEEEAIFNAAVGDYPMLNAKAEEVGARAIPNGKEFLFIASDQPREDQPDMPRGMMKVYVTVLDGQAPEFTQVVR